MEENEGLSKVIRTLAVRVDNDLGVTLYINRAFYESLIQESKIAVLQHEINHLLRKHLIRIEDRNSFCWNLAADLAINQHLKGLPYGSLCPKCNIVILPVNNKLVDKCPKCKLALDLKKDICECLLIEKFKIEGKKVKLEPDQPAEKYYDILWKELPKIVIQIGGQITQQREQDAKGQIGKGNGENKEGEGNQQQGDGKGEKQSNTIGSGWVEINGEKIPFAFDDHGVWSTGADNKEMAHEKIKDMVSKAVAQMEERTQGTMPGYLKELIDSCLKHKTLNWKSELRRFVGYEEFAKFIPTRKKLNRRYPLMPGNKVLRKAHMLVACDSSGSVGDEEFAKFFKEIDMIRHAGVSITLVECDADIQSVEEYKRLPPKVKRIGYGGTDFRPVFKLVKDGKYKKFKLTTKKVDGIIYLTDGAGTYPSPKDITTPVIWVIIASQENNKYGYSEKLGRRVVMKED